MQNSQELAGRTWSLLFLGRALGFLKGHSALSSTPQSCTAASPSRPGEELTQGGGIC